MIADMGHDVSACTVSEDGSSFAKLIDAMYAPEAPVTSDCIDVLSGKWNVHMYIHTWGAMMQTVGRRKLQTISPIKKSS